MHIRATVIFEAESRGTSSSKDFSSIRRF